VKTTAGAEPLLASRIRLEWDDGTELVVDVTAELRKAGVFAFLTDPAAFNAATVSARSRTLVWQGPKDDEIDLCADALLCTRARARRCGKPDFKD
jgi:Protein of unknown function (DUF2442)